MATFLTREGIVYHLGKIIEEADRELVLISPYIKADDETKNLLKNKTRATTIHVIYGKKKLKSSEKPTSTNSASRPLFSRIFMQSAT